jgi:DNA-binding NarL/FixJ family response regulator
MNQLANAFSHTKNPDEMGAQRLDSKGQFAYFATPAHLWPDFLVGQISQPLRVVLIEDETHLRGVVGNDLGLDPRTTLVATASNMREGKHLVETYVFDVLLLDLNMYNGMSFELLKFSKMMRPNAEVIVISKMDDLQNATKAFNLGASGFILKDSWFGDFAQAVLQVANGGSFVSPNLARKLIQKISNNSMGDAQNASSQVISLPGNNILSYREREILELVANGYTSSAIALKINISTQTVTTHIKNIYRKLQVHTRAQAVSSAKSQGLLS